MAQLQPRLAGRNDDPRWIGRKVGRNIGGVMKGLSYGAGEPELEPIASDGGEGYIGTGEEIAEDVTPPLSSSKPQYPRAKPLTGFQKFADVLGGGRVGAQVANINAHSQLAEAEDVAKSNLQSSKFQQDKLMEGVRAGDSKSLAILKQHLDTLQSVGLPYTPENLEFMLKMQQQPVDYKPTNLAEKSTQAGFEKQSVTNKLGEANALESVARANKMQTELDPRLIDANLRSTLAGTKFKELEAERLQKQLKTGFTPVPFREGVVDSQGNSLIFQPDEPSKIDLSTGQFVPPKGGGLKRLNIDGNSTPTPTTTPTEWEDATYRYRKLPDGTVQRKLK